VEALGGSPIRSAETQRLLLQALDHPDPVVCATAAEALGKRKVQDATLPMLKRLAQFHPEEDVEVMMTLIEALGEIGDRRAEPHLVRWLSYPQPALADTAAAALKALTGHDPVRPPLAPVHRTLSPEAISFLRQALPDEQQGRSVRVLVRTSQGDLRLRLHVAAAPLTCWNFVRLARRHYFDGVTFHRVVPNFVAQGGDPRGDGWGGPGYNIRCEYNNLHYERGAVGMALAGKDTGGSQFFITHSVQPHLDGSYTIFAQLEQGGDVLDRLTEGDKMSRVTVAESR
jgi:cyclophilin family peptidyl-prolyl cis-trans isomerase